MAGLIGVLLGWYEDARNQHLGALDKRAGVLDHRATRLNERIRDLEVSNYLMCLQHKDLERLLRTPSAKLDTECVAFAPKRNDQPEGP